MSTSETNLATNSVGSAATGAPVSLTTKLPKIVFDTDPAIYAFPPNRETLGGTAYLISPVAASNSESSVKNNILIDCPAWSDTNVDFITEQGGLRWLVMTHRGGSSRVQDWQSKFQCDVVVQEQEAYLLPKIETQTFHRELVLTPSHRLLWTPGHSPGSTCVYSAAHGGILFTGRHLLPTRSAGVTPLRVSKTFHWPRQLRHVQRLLGEFTPQTLSYLCPGANTGFLRGERAIQNAYEQLTRLDFQRLATTQPLL